ncbi:hypothetical protein P4B35_03750 [Pontiellaceae bacterium B12227]|nr:hypothetical protein [Pontiellaceae bacterium B12227]
MKFYYFYLLIFFVVALIRGLKKGKRAGYTIFSVLGVLVALYTFNIFGYLSHTLMNKGMGAPEVLGNGLGSLLAMALSTSIALGVYSILFMLIKFNKKDLVAELCCLAMTTVIVISSLQLVGTLSEASKEYDTVGVSPGQAKAAVTLHYD